MKKEFGISYVTGDFWKQYYLLNKYKGDLVLFHILKICVKILI